MSLKRTLSTKLHRPQYFKQLVVRTRLLDGLNAQLADRRLTIISAPAGYGKTTLAAHWLSTLETPTAWLSLDALDNNLETFANYVVAALHQACRIDCPQLSELLLAPQAAVAAVAADALVEDLANLPISIILVLDDYHVITDEQIQSFMSRVLQYLPTNCHIVLLTRQMPPWPLSRLRASGGLMEVGAEALRFTTPEAQQLLSGLLQTPVDEETAARVDQQLEGWAMGLQLVGLSHRAPDRFALLKRESWDDNTIVTNYLLDEVLAQQSPDVRELLVRSSILQRFCDPLVSAVLGPGYPVGIQDGWRESSTLTALHRANLFLVPLDQRSFWYRYHHAFQALLLQRLHLSVSDDEIRAMHRRASDWFMEVGLPEEAIQHALAAGDETSAERIVMSQTHRLLDGEDWRSLNRMIELLPRTLQRRPAMRIARGWVLHYLSRFLAIDGIVGKAAAELDVSAAGYEPEEHRLLQAQTAALRAAGAYWGGRPEEGLVLAQDAIQGLSPDMLYARSMMHYFIAVCRHAVGRSAEGLAGLEQTLAEQPSLPPTATSRFLLAQMTILLARGDFPRFRQVADSLYRLGSRADLPITIGWAKYGRGIVAYEWNELPLANETMSQLVQSPHGLNGRAALDSFLALSLTLEAQGRTSASDEVVRRFNDYIVESGFADALVVLEALRLRLAAMRGEKLSSPGARVIPTPEAGRRDLRLSFIITPWLSRVHYLLVSGQPADLKEARAILDASSEAAESLDERRRLAEILALRACLESACGDEAAALAALERSLGLGEPGRLIRTYVDCGPSLKSLLEALIHRGDSAHLNYAHRLLGAFAGAAAISMKQSGETAPSRDNALVQMKASLTHREREVLLLLATRASNKEIASHMVITIETVKKYTRAIYQKLGVNNRRAAVSMAEFMGLIPPVS